MRSIAVRRHNTLATLLAVLVILHGSLFPYEFRVPPGSGGPVDALLNSWADHPSSLGDMLANVMLYMPFGLFAALAARHRKVDLCLVTLVGAVLSTSMELLQFYDADRVTSLWDVASNGVGTMLGASAGLLVATRPSVPLLRSISANPVPSLLLIAMLGYRLVPYVPVVDLHKYWNALKPLVSGPLPAPVDVFNYFTLWVTASELVAEIFGAVPSLLLAPLLVGFVLAAKVAIYASVLTRAELAGAGLAVLLAWPLLHRSPGRAGTVALLLLVSVVIDRLTPFAFQPEAARPFGWLPFRSFLGGSLLVNTAAFCEKVFRYGSLLWLWQRAGLRPWTAVLLVGSTLLATSLAQTILPGRSAEITDTVLVLFVAVLLKALAPGMPA
jgi:VanZ family protein